MFKYLNIQGRRGFTIFFAVLVTSLALAIGLAIYDITVRELDLSGVANQSQYAIYAADTGAECALYWDTHCQASGCNAGSAFPTSTESTAPAAGQGLLCNGQDIVATPWVLEEGDLAATTTFTVSIPNSPSDPTQTYCVIVTVAKTGTPARTVVVSHGYNTCAAGGVTRLERALQVSY